MHSQGLRNNACIALCTCGMVYAVLHAQSSLCLCADWFTGSVLGVLILLQACADHIDHWLSDMAIVQCCTGSDVGMHQMQEQHDTDLIQICRQIIVYAVAAHTELQLLLRGLIPLTGYLPESLNVPGKAQTNHLDKDSCGSSKTNAAEPVHTCHDVGYARLQHHRQHMQMIAVWPLTERVMHRTLPGTEATKKLCPMHRRNIFYGLPAVIIQSD